jgi:putative hydrolase of the HAD superfamily
MLYIFLKGWDEMPRCNSLGNHELKAVIFDVGGTLETLIENDNLRLLACRHMLRTMRDAGAKLDLAPAELLSLIKTGFGQYFAHRATTYRELIPVDIWRYYVFNQLLLTDTTLVGVLQALGEELAFIWDTEGYQRIMRPEVPDTLSRLKELGLRIGIASNVFSTHQVYHDLARFGITSFFDPIVLSVACSHRKPAPPIFHLAADLAGVAPESCLYIGDSLYYDIGGAKSAGFGYAVFLDAPYTEAPAYDAQGVEPDAVISSLSELVEILEQACTGSL